MSNIAEQEEKQMNEIARKEDNILNPLALIDKAMATGQTPDSIDKLMELQERWQRNEAEKDFNLAMSEFSANAPKILKDSTVDFNSQKGNTNYKHATLSNIVSAVQPVMSKLGLSHRWKTTQNEREITVECVITHKSGHSESTSLTAPPDQTGNKNTIQSIGSTVTYLQRYTLQSALGIATFQDDDAVGYERTFISDDQVEELRDLKKRANLNPDSLEKFRSYLRTHHKARSISDLSVNSFRDVKNNLLRHVAITEKKS